METSAALAAKADAAEQAATDARDKIAEVEAAIIAGSSKLSISDLEGQERAARAAALEAKAARIRVADAVAKEQAAQIARVRAEITDSSNAHLHKLLKELGKAALAFTAAALEHNDRVHRWHRELTDAGCEVNIERDGLTLGDNGLRSIHIDGSHVCLIPNIDHIVHVVPVWEAGETTDNPYLELSAYAPEF